MKLNGNTILVTGGTSGIGLGLVRRFVQLGNQVIVSGSNEQKLAQVRQELPAVATERVDLSKPEERVRLFEKVTAEHPTLNVVVNNAGIQRYIPLNKPEPWADTAREIETNLSAPIHLNMLFSPFLEKQKDAAIVITTSGLAHVPYAKAPIYSATKAALRSYTLSLRYHLRNAGVEVIEVSPPKVNTDLGGPGLHDDGTPLNEYCDSVIEGLRKGEQEILYGFSFKLGNASRAERDQLFKALNP